jgi:hypothetical protein
MCRPQMQLVFDAPLNTREFSYLSSRQLGSKITVTGVYNEYKTGLTSIPAIYIYDHRDGTGYILLKQKMSYPFKSLVRVEGEISSLMMPYKGIDVEAKMQALQVTASETLTDVSPAAGIAQSSFQEYYRNISEKIALPGSQLKLPLQPDWQMAWIGSERSVICFMRCADLMYEAEVDLFFEPSMKRVEKICAWQRFKGE